MPSHFMSQFLYSRQLINACKMGSNRKDNVKDMLVTILHRDTITNGFLFMTFFRNEKSRYRRVFKRIKCNDNEDVLLKERALFVLRRKKKTDLIPSCSLGQSSWLGSQTILNRTLLQAANLTQAFDRHRLMLNLLPRIVL